jgi:hypothetical protein
MKIRAYAKAAGFEVVGKLQYMGKWDLCSRWYMDEALNAYLVDTVIGGISIIPSRKSEHK